MQYLLLTCVASVSSERKAIFRFLAAREIGRAQKKKEEGGRGGERKETLADRPRYFENRPLRNSRLIALDEIAYVLKLSYINQLKRGGMERNKLGHT